MVYVLAHNGSPLMPTANHGYVRKLLSSRKAVVVQTKPFTIRLKYRTEGKTQPLVCGIDHYHHVKPRSKGGSETLDNRVGLCEKHHVLVHTDTVWAGKLADAKAGLNKKYGALSVLNQIIPRMVQELVKTGLAVRVTDGRSTKAYREASGIEKDHNLDAYCIACSALEVQSVIDPPKEHYDLRRFRRHDRAAVSRQEERKYYLDGTLVARNRRKRMEQQTDSLAEFRAKNPDAVGRLKVVEGGVKYKNPKRILPGAIFSVNGARMVFQGSTGFHNGAPDYFTFCETTKKYRPKKCKLISTGGGWQFT